MVRNLLLGKCFSRGNARQGYLIVSRARVLIGPPSRVRAERDLHFSFHQRKALVAPATAIGQESDKHLFTSRTPRFFKAQTMTIRVVARIRPAQKHELEKDTIVKAASIGDDAPTLVKVPNPKSEHELFTFQFSSVYDEAAEQQTIFDAESMFRYVYTYV